MRREKFPPAFRIWELYLGGYVDWRDIRAVGFELGLKFRLWTSLALRAFVDQFNLLVYLLVDARGVAHSDALVNTLHDKMDGGMHPIIFPIHVTISLSREKPHQWNSKNALLSQSFPQGPAEQTAKK